MFFSKHDDHFEIVGRTYRSFDCIDIGPMFEGVKVSQFIEFTVHE